MKFLIVLLSLLIATIALPEICSNVNDISDHMEKFKSNSEISQTKACFSYLIEKG